MFNARRSPVRVNNLIRILCFQFNSVFKNSQQQRKQEISHRKPSNKALSFFIIIENNYENISIITFSAIRQYIMHTHIRCTSGANRTRAGQGICVLWQSILGHFRPLLDIFGAKGLFKDTFLFEGRGCIPFILDASLER